MFNEKSQACVSDLARRYRNHQSNWWKVILVDNNQRKISLTVPSNCCEKLDFLAIVRPIIAFFFLTISLTFWMLVLSSVAAQQICVSRDIFEKMLVNLKISMGTKC